MHDSSHSPMTPAEAAFLRDASPVDEALLQRIRAALVARNVDDATAAEKTQDGATDETDAGETDTDTSTDTGAGTGTGTEEVDTGDDDAEA